jgi:hypothetical protein
MTDYLILRSLPDPRAKGDEAAQVLWHVYDRHSAVSKEAAIRHCLSGAEDASGEFVAVPARSWQPVKVSVETALKFS